MQNFSAITTFYGRLMAARRGEDGGVQGSLPGQGGGWLRGQQTLVSQNTVGSQKFLDIKNPGFKRFQDSVKNVDNVDNVDNVNNVENMGLRMDTNSTVCKKLRKHNPKKEMCLKVNAFCWWLWWPVQRSLGNLMTCYNCSNMWDLNRRVATTQFCDPCMYYLPVSAWHQCQNRFYASKVDVIQDHTCYNTESTHRRIVMQSKEEAMKRDC